MWQRRITVSQYQDQSDVWLHSSIYDIAPKFGWKFAWLTNLTNNGRGRFVWYIAPRWTLKWKSIEIKNIPQYKEGQQVLHWRIGFCLLRGGGGGNPYHLSDKIFEGYLMTFLNLPQLFLKFTQFDWMNQNLIHGWDCGSQMPLKCDTFCWITVSFCPIQPFNHRRGCYPIQILCLL